MLQAVSLTCRRGQRRVFSELSLRLDAGQCCLVSGPNGSGKTSLLRILANITQADEGQLIWRDRAVQRNDSDYRRQVVYGGHAPGLNGSLSVQENLDSLLM
ncbi:ABC transporter ATP-binding protein, partial [Alcaligenes pakistanensis]